MKRLAKETAVYGLSSIVGRFLNWMLVPMYTRVLAGTGDYGIVTNLYGWTALLLVLLTYGMETGFFRFINKKEEQEPMRVYASVLYCLLGSSALFSVAVFALLPSISAGLGYGDHPEYIGMMAGGDKLVLSSGLWGRLCTRGERVYDTDNLIAFDPGYLAGHTGESRRNGIETNLALFLPDPHSRYCRYL